MESLKEQVRTIANDLVKLEINTILKAEITGGKMPHPLHALVDIAGLYRRYLEHYEAHYLLYLESALGPEPRPCSAWKTFNWLREWSDRGIERLAEEESQRPGEPGFDKQPAALSPEQEAHYNRLSRIRDTCDRFKGMLESLRGEQDGKLPGGLRIMLGLTAQQPAQGEDFTHGGIEGLRVKLEQPRLRVPFTSDELVSIRKAWEIGLERIVMQTVVQLDGDIITRIHPHFTTPEHQTLHQYHHRTTEQSIQLWQQFIAAVVGFFERIILGLFGKP
ncbi:MAG: hypothetical protein R3310_08155 [Candidatus Competibacteraceae bacterium]|nr:hypothetical protein [Candidatus Competibacteraceae bacterium]